LRRRNVGVWMKISMSFKQCTHEMHREHTRNLHLNNHLFRSKLAVQYTMSCVIWCDCKLRWLDRNNSCVKTGPGK
jgi:hypothetical protein